VGVRRERDGLSSSRNGCYWLNGPPSLRHERAGLGRKVNCMARIIFLSPEWSPLGHMFIVDRAVGHHCANHRLDVLLVQFFFRTLIQTPLGGPAIPLDGICGQQQFIGLDISRHCTQIATAGRGFERPDKGVAARTISSRLVSVPTTTRGRSVPLHPAHPYKTVRPTPLPSESSLPVALPTTTRGRSVPSGEVPLSQAHPRYKTVPPTRLPSGSSPRQIRIHTFASTTERSGHPSTAG
jgi:hypothetical protein